MLQGAAQDERQKNSKINFEKYHFTFLTLVNACDLP